VSGYLPVSTKEGIDDHIRLLALMHLLPVLDSAACATIYQVDESIDT
jgi:hypothetical protein